jgi:copper chaperone NosL
MALGVCVLLVCCGPKEITPVDIYPEDKCAHCRMAVTDQRFASEIISDKREVFKFDDIGCLEEFYKMKPRTLTVSAVFYKDYATRAWVAAAAATVVETEIMTPMNSGKVAFADSSAAEKFRIEHPRTKPVEEMKQKQSAIPPPTMQPGRE